MSDLNMPKLWYRQPAVEWTEALPIGNGRLGAMVFSGVAREHLQLNEDTLWAGGPYQPTNPEALPHLEELRALIFAGRYTEAELLANQHAMAKPHLEMSYQPAGDLRLDFAGGEAAEEYRRELDLDRAVVVTTYRQGGIAYRREAFVSAVDQVLVLRLSADRAGAVSADLGLDSEQQGTTRVTAPGVLRFDGVSRPEHGIPAALRFAIEARVRTSGGGLTSSAKGIAIRDADEAVIVLDIATSFRRFDDVSGDPDAALRARLDAVATKPWDELLAAHLAEHRRLFRRLTISLGPSGGDALPTDERIAHSEELSDPALAALYVQYGRYLMLSSSRPGTQPATLQGIWNKEIVPPWGSKYTANINLQMNYWLPDPANLSECVEPLLRLAEDVAITGAEMARAHYGARGWVMHHNTDLWRATGPVDGAKWGLWPTGGAWLMAQLWDHADFTGDAALVDRLWPLLRGASQFFLDTLVPLPGTDRLVTNPSLSPENVHLFGAAICAGPTMDNQILRDLFDATIEASERLVEDPAFRAEIGAARARLPADRIGAAGQLQEWLEDWDMQAPEMDHRHVSHLYGLYPAHQIDLDKTPELAAAARRSLSIRGDNATGWGIGWRINLWARLRDGDHAHDVVKLLLGPERTYPNMFDAHPPFQIDGNFGGAAGILEMLLQSSRGRLHLLPALPGAWPDGDVAGLRARGGLEVALLWRAGRLVTATIAFTRAAITSLRYGDIETTVAAGAFAILDLSLTADGTTLTQSWR